VELSQVYLVFSRLSSFRPTFQGDSAVQAAARPPTAARSDDASYAIAAGLAPIPSRSLARAHAAAVPLVSSLLAGEERRGGERTRRREEEGREEAAGHEETRDTRKRGGRGERERGGAEGAPAARNKVPCVRHATAAAHARAIRV